MLYYIMKNSINIKEIDDNLKIISNKMIIDKHGNLVKFDDLIIHSMN